MSKHLAWRCGWVTNRFTVGISASIVPVWSLDVAASRALCVAAGEGLGGSIVNSCVDDRNEFGAFLGGHTSGTSQHRKCSLANVHSPISIRMRVTPSTSPGMWSICQAAANSCHSTPACLLDRHIERKCNVALAWREWLLHTQATRIPSMV